MHWNEWLASGMLVADAIWLVVGLHRVKIRSKRRRADWDKVFSEIKESERLGTNALISKSSRLTIRS
jgi:hypothetical protein